MKDIEPPTSPNKLSLFKFGENDVRIVIKTGNPWFVGNDVCNALGLENVSRAISNLDDDEKDNIITRNVAGKSQKIKIINKQGIINLLNGTRKAIPDGLLKLLNREFGIILNIHKRYSKETETIEAICICFKDVLYIQQYSVGKYRVDLYFKKNKIVIECDEFGHYDRDNIYEITRENFIKEKLGCIFYRFNPDAESFSIYNVLYDIRMLLK